MMLWLPRYYRDSKVAIQAKSTGRRGDRSINDHVTSVLTSSSRYQKNQKEKKRNKKKKEKETMKTKIKT